MTHLERSAVVSKTYETDNESANSDHLSTNVNHTPPYRRRVTPSIIRKSECNEEGHIERFCRKERKTRYLSKRNDICRQMDFIIPGQIEEQKVVIVLDLGCDMTLVNSDLVHPK